MNRFTYALRYLIKSRGNNLLRILSIGLGLAVGLLLTAQVGFELSFDRFFPDNERLYYIQNNYQVNGEEFENQHLMAPLAPALQEFFPQVEAATRIWNPGEGPYYKGEDVYKINTLFTDASFFEVLNYGLLSGDPGTALKRSDQVFISRRYAERMFPGEDPAGKIILYNNQLPLTIAGVFENIPRNSHLQFDLVSSFERVAGFGLYTHWDGGYSFPCYVKLAPGTDPQTVEKGFKDFFLVYMGESGRQLANEESFILLPVKDFHLLSGSTRQRIIMLTILSLVILGIVAMNYMLISVSSLVQRARTIAVHKCNGARQKDIFAIFLWETLLIVLIGVFLAFMLLTVFRNLISHLTGESLETLFSPERLWIPSVALVLLVLVTGILPGRIFARIPVTEVFRRLSVHKKAWKKSLLFIQFAGAAFIFAFLLIVVRQYQLFLTKDLGYQPENVVYIELEDHRPSVYRKAMEQLETLPQVQATALIEYTFESGLSGQAAFDENGEMLFGCRTFDLDHKSIPLFGIEILQGENFSESSAPHHVIVNEKYVELRRWDDSPIGKTIHDHRSIYEPKTIVGVVRNFSINSFHSEQQPLVLHPLELDDDQQYSYTLAVRVDRIDPQIISGIKNEVESLLPPRTEVGISLFSDSIQRLYKREEYLRNTVISGSIIIFLIAMMGMIGYLNDEIQRKNKEIAIRKVHGAKIADILLSLSKELFVLALFAVTFGLGLSFYFGKDWLRQFANKTNLSLWIFLASAFTVLVIMLLTIVIRTWKIVRENPVKNIQSE